MRHTHRCPRCDHDEVLYVPRLRDSNFDEMTLDTHSGFLSKDSVGVFEAYVCRGCGYTEFYVKDAAAIEPKDLEGARRLRAAPPRGYR